MTDAHATEWTEADFEKLSWHDNTVYAIRLVEGEYGAGRILFDIDFILEWLGDDAGGVKFRIAPATLEFREVTNLKVALDYATPAAGLVPFSLNRIERRVERRERYDAILWALIVNWPVGSITFEASGFRQVLRGPVVECSQQSLGNKVSRIP